ncbi:hypothetical protein GE09DRAFT_1221281 [Coniochaeta sp. 2T2.1]|nr:hypothetical protein GE09DRAFT_1221281 [Coniochaeta sp. 2T2.1]
MKDADSNPSSSGQQDSRVDQLDVPSASPRTAQRPVRKPQSLLPPGASGALDVILPSITVGGATAVAGALSGTVAGIVRSQPVGLFTLFAAGQWFVLGSSYYGARQVAINAYGGNDSMTATDKVRASGLAGGFAGMLAGSIRGRANIIPGIIFWSVAGAGGQAVGGALFGRNYGAKYLASRWSPVTPLTDRQYEKMLEEKLLKVDAEIAIIDENIQEIRNKAQLPRP